MKLLSSLLFVVFSLAFQLLNAQDLLLENATVLDPQSPNAYRTLPISLKANVSISRASLSCLPLLICIPTLGAMQELLVRWRC